MNQNEPIFLNLYIRDTESYRKITKIVGNKQIMRVKKLISFYEIQHFFQSSFRTQSPKLLIERKFSEFLCLLCKDSEKLVHFGSFNKIHFLYIYVCYRTRACGAYLRKFSR